MTTTFITPATAGFVVVDSYGIVWGAGVTERDAIADCDDDIDVGACDVREATKGALDFVRDAGGEQGLPTLAGVAVSPVGDDGLLVEAVEQVLRDLFSVGDVFVEDKAANELRIVRCVDVYDDDDVDVVWHVRAAHQGAEHPLWLHEVLFGREASGDLSWREPFDAPDKDERRFPVDGWLRLALTEPRHHHEALRRLAEEVVLGWGR